jgi:DNA polymerase III epsilon subunit-like protein
MKVLVFDVETTGLPIGKNPSITELDKWPYIVQLSYVMYDASANDITLSYDEILKLPDNVEISEESIKLHKITPQINKEKGINRQVALQTFNSILEQSDIIVGHNISFDKRMLMVECARNRVYHRFTHKGVKKIEYCTMKNSVEVCKIEKTNYKGETFFKYPTLTELYYCLFKDLPTNTHNSFVDVLLCLRCYVKLNYDVDLLEINELFRDLIKSNSIVSI